MEEKNHGTILILKGFAVLLSLVLLYMLFTQEIRVFHTDSRGAEIITLFQHPFRFLGIFAMVAFVDWKLIQKIKELK